MDRPGRSLVPVSPIASHPSRTPLVFFFCSCARLRSVAFCRAVAATAAAAASLLFVSRPRRSGRTGDARRSSARLHSDRAMRAPRTAAASLCSARALVFCFIWCSASFVSRHPKAQVSARCSATHACRSSSARAEPASLTSAEATGVLATDVLAEVEGVLLLVGITALRDLPYLPCLRVAWATFIATRALPPVAAAAVKAGAAAAVASDGSIWISADIVGAAPPQPCPAPTPAPPPRCAILPVHFSGEMKISEPGGAVLAPRDDEGTIMPLPSARPRDLVAAR